MDGHGRTGEGMTVWWLLVLMIAVALLAAMGGEV